MPLTAQTRRRSRPLGLMGTIMSNCLAAGLPVASSCSGRGTCSLCRVQVLRSWDALSPMDDRELEVLARNGAEPGERLSCQARVMDVQADIAITTGYW